MKRIEIELQIRNIIHAMSMGIDYDRLEDLYDYYLEQLRTCNVNI